MSKKYDINKHLPIGVFDSGIGGLTVLDKLLEILPNEDYVYVGDTINLPYGTKTPERLKEIVSGVANYLVDVPVKAIVIACNTATANSHHLNETIDIPVIGVIEPTAKAALAVSENIMVLATNVTIESNEYQDIINKYRKDEKANQYYVKCSEFVDAIEANNINTESSHKLVRDKLENYLDKKVDVIILGCTHFGLYSNELKALFPDAVLMPCSIPTGEELKRVLEKDGLLNDNVHQSDVEINLTLKHDNFEDKTKWFKKPVRKVQEIKIK